MTRVQYPIYKPGSCSIVAKCITFIFNPELESHNALKWNNWLRITWLRADKRKNCQFISLLFFINRSFVGMPFRFVPTGCGEKVPWVKSFFFESFSCQPPADYRSTFARIPCFHFVFWWWLFERCWSDLSWVNVFLALDPDGKAYNYEQCWRRRRRFVVIVACVDVVVAAVAETLSLSRNRWLLIGTSRPGSTTDDVLLAPGRSLLKQLPSKRTNERTGSTRLLTIWSGTLSG